MGLTSGYVALSAAKGGTLHRKSGMLFVFCDGHDVYHGDADRGCRERRAGDQYPFCVADVLPGDPLFMFGGVGLSASAGDFRMIRAGGVRGAPRLARHLWRMCFALFIASIAFFLGRGRVPEAIRTPALLAVGVLLPIVVMLYWLWRLRIRKTSLGIVGVSTPQVSGATK
jgi:hypothetical protein